MEEALEPLLGPASARRPMVVAAHPDDEVIGASTLLFELSGWTVIHLTDGAPRDRRLHPEGAPTSRERYALLRAEEARTALEIAGISREQVFCLGAVDQEAVDELPRLTRLLLGTFEELVPSVVLVHPYEGGHPDHDAAAFAVHTAAWLLRRAGRPFPRVVEMSSYFQRDGRLVAGDFLPSLHPVVTVALTESQKARKRRMQACFASQRQVLAGFSLEHERFRRAPRYDFCWPPHPGTLHFEAQGWRDGAQWRARAREALHVLDIEEGPWL